MNKKIKKFVLEKKKVKSRLNERKENEKKKKT